MRTIVMYSSCLIDMRKGKSLVLMLKLPYNMVFPPEKEI